MSWIISHAISAVKSETPHPRLALDPPDPHRLDPSARSINSNSHRSSGPHRNHPRTTLRLPGPRLLLPRPRSDRRPSTKHLRRGRPPAKHLRRGRQTSLRSSPSDRHRPCTRRRLPPPDLLLRHVRHPHQGHQVFISDVLMGFQHLLR